MITDTLIKKLNKKLFVNTDSEHVLDLRDDDVFDSEWSRVNKAVELLKNSAGYSEENKKLSDCCREKVYLKVFKLCGDDDLAAYISDDFGLIYDSEIIGYTDLWLQSLIRTYMDNKIPCGTL